MENPRSFWRLGALATALALAGCASLTAVPTDPQAGVAVPPGWAAPAPTAPAENAARTAALAQWWQQFNDPTLSTLIAEALAANTSVASAQAALRQARALAEVQQAQLGPSVGSSASAQRTRTEAAGSTNTFRAGFDASWEPDVFGGNRASRNAAQLDAQASAASLADTQVSVAAEVALDYITLRSTELRLQIAKANLASQQETLQITQWRVQAGLATSLDSEQARAAVEQTRAQIPSLQTTLAQTRHQLALLTGRAAGTLALPAAAPKLTASSGATSEAVSAAINAAINSTVPQAPDTLALSFPAETLRQRADVRAAETKASAAAQRVVQAAAARYPSFSLSGSLGLSALTLSGLTGGGALASSVLASVSWPIFDGGAAKAQVRAQQAALDQARETHRAAVLTALKDVEDALVALQGDRERAATLANAADAAANAALLARQRYSSGLVDFQTVLDTQRSLLSAQDSLASTRADLAADHVRLYKALGGGWQPDDTARAEAAPSTKEQT